jgi:formamidopyrimidine-DNA glycosylase
MIEIPEAAALARQINETIAGRQIARVQAARSPHKFAWYQGNPAGYPALLEGRVIEEACPLGGTLELRAGDARLALSEGVRLAWHPPGSPLPQRHQLLLEFAGGGAPSASVQMYGGLLAFREGRADNPYYLTAREKHSPLTDAFDRAYFDRLIAGLEDRRVSAKALLATEQRIPGLGNGVLQDILHNAGLHPKRRLESISADELGGLYASVKATLKDMAARGGRDTETDLFGQPGGYATRCSKFTLGKPCARCATPIQKAACMGGSVYFCPACQPL